MKKITTEQLKALKDTLKVFEVREYNPQKESKKTKGWCGICPILAIKLKSIIEYQDDVPILLNIEVLELIYPEMMKEIILKFKKRDSPYAWKMNNNTYRIKFLTKWIKKYEKENKKGI